jgi:hypothetical protein
MAAEFTCIGCGIEVYIVTAETPPADSLCLECRVIGQAAPEDRAALARALRHEDASEEGGAA